MQKGLTEQQYWENYWEGVRLPLEIKKENSAPNILAELEVFEKYLPKEKMQMLEVGGAPGQYLAWFHKAFGYNVCCLDYTSTGCEKTKENFKLLKIQGKVYQGDLFSEKTSYPQFDIVCSFGFVEHFTDLNHVVGKHLGLLKPGGILILGVPNFLGINHLFLKQLAPELLSGHNLKSMDKNTWTVFEKAYQLDVIFKDYVGGFEPAVFLKKEKKSILNDLLFFKARLLNRIFHENFHWLRKFNSKHFSGYLLGIYRKPKN